MSTILRRGSSLAALVLLALGGCTTARMETPHALAASEPWPVSGSNPRVWSRPLSFGPWHTARVEEGTTRSWALEAFGLGGGAIRRPYLLVLVGADGDEREVACMNRAAELWRGSFTLDISEMVAPRLACAVEGPDGSVQATLALEERAGRVSGVLRLSQGEGLTVSSSHQLVGSRIPSGDPVGYVVSRGGHALAAVETINRGRVWILPGLDSATREALAATAAALLLFDSTLSQR